MKYNVNEIVRRVFALLDENEVIMQERVEYGDPGTMLRPLILDLLPVAARVVIAAAPLSVIDSCLHLGGLKPVADGVNAVVLPDDFLRLVYVRMSDWKTGVEVPLECGSPDYKLRVGAVVSGERRRLSPAVAVRWRGDRRYLEIFGSAPDAVIAELDYVALPAIEGSYIELPSRLLGDICAKTAEMVLNVLER